MRVPFLTSSLCLCIVLFQLVASNKPFILSACGVSDYPLFDCVAQSVQVVAGLNYFIKIKVGEGDNDYIHVAIYKMLNGQSELKKVETGKSLADAL